MSEERSSIFRQEALDHLAKAYRPEGDLLRISPTWAKWAYWVLILVVLVGLLFMILEDVPEYAEGPAVIWVERTFVTANSPGTVARVRVRRGQHVSAQMPLVYFRGVQNPTELSCVRAPHSGTVGEVLIREAQGFSAGDVLLSLMKDDGESGWSVIAMLPAHYRPLLSVEMPLRLELAGYPHARQEVAIDFLANEAIGPNAVRRYLGPDIADTVPVQGSVVLVRARLGPTFEAGGRLCDYYHGMQATATVRVRSESILIRLLPWLKAPFGDTDG